MFTSHEFPFPTALLNGTPQNVASKPHGIGQFEVFWENVL